MKSLTIPTRNLSSCLPESNFIEILGAIPTKEISLLDLQCNRIPTTPSERASIEENISSSNPSIHVLEAGLKSIQTVATKLEEKLSNLREYQAIQSSLLAPIRRLPDELLVEVFHFVQGGIIMIDDNVPCQIWDLEAVCVHWRKLVCDRPYLWNNFALCNCTGISTYTAGRRVLSCLEYSRSAPLEITLSFTEWERDPAGFYYGVFEDIALHASRWKSLEINVPFLRKALVATNARFLIENRGLSQLGTLILSNGVQTKDSWPLFNSATALEELALVSTTPLENATSFPYENIYKFEVVNTSFAVEDGLDGFDIGKILHAMPSLEELVWNTNEKKLVTRSEISLPLLHTLCITESNDFYPILKYLRVPSLATLSVFSKADLGDVLPHLLDFLCENDITRLELDLKSVQEVWQVVDKLYTVTELSLIDQTISRAVLGHLVYGTSKVLPTLETLELNGSSSTCLQFGSLYHLPQIAKSRSYSTGRPWSLDAPLTYVKISGCISIRDKLEYEMMLDDLERTGVGITSEVSYRDGAEYSSL